MTQPEVLDQDIRALQDWLRAAWQQLGDPALTPFTRRELRNQMKQCAADLRAHLQRAEELDAQFRQARASHPGLELAGDLLPRRFSLFSRRRRLILTTRAKLKFRATKSRLGRYIAHEALSAAAH